MIYIACLLIGVFGGLWCAFKFDDTRRRWAAHRAWDRETSEALAIVNGEAADRDREFTAWMREHGADQ